MTTVKPRPVHSPLNPSRTRCFRALSRVASTAVAADVTCSDCRKELQTIAAAARFRTAAERMHGSDEVEIDGAGIPSESLEGAWVPAWVWVPFETCAKCVAPATGVLPGEAPQVLCTSCAEAARLLAAELAAAPARPRIGLDRAIELAKVAGRRERTRREKVLRSGGDYLPRLVPRVGTAFDIDGPVGANVALSRAYQCGLNSW